MTRSLKTLAAALLLTLVPLFVSCNKDEDEKESTGGTFTLKVSLPEDTTAGDAIYIVGEFNGGEDFAVGNPKWRLVWDAAAKAEDQPGPFPTATITLNPDEFVGGKTLADGFWFESGTRGKEVIDAPRTLSAKSGKTYEFTVTAWTKAAGPSFDPSGTWTIVGTVNGWNEKAGLAMTGEGTTWIAQGVELKATDEFKFVMDASWSTNFGAGAPNTKFAAVIGEEFSLEADGGNITAPAGTYDIYLYPFDAKAKIVEASVVPPTPQEKPVTGVSLAPTELSLEVGGSQTLTATITPADADVKSIAWTSSDESVATVSQNGLVSAVAEGTATITVTVDGFTATCAVSVSAVTPPPAEGVKLYVFNSTGWENFYLYGWTTEWGDVDSISWPGTGYNRFETVSGNTYHVFELSAAWCGSEVNLIFNNGEDTAKTPDFPITMTGGGSYYLHVKAGSVEAIADPATFDPSAGPGEEIVPGTDPTNAWSVIGHLMGTDWDTDLVMTETSTGVWEVDITYAEGDAFKLRFNGNWDVQAGMWGSDPSDTMDITWDYGLNGNSGENKDIRLNATGKMRLKFTTEDYKLYVTKY